MQRGAAYGSNIADIGSDASRVLVRNTKATPPAPTKNNWPINCLQYAACVQPWPTIGVLHNIYMSSARCAYSAVTRSTLSRQRRVVHGPPSNDVLETSKAFSKLPTEQKRGYVRSHQRRCLAVQLSHAKSDIGGRGGGNAYYCHAHFTRKKLTSNFRFAENKVVVCQVRNYQLCNATAHFC